MLSLCVYMGGALPAGAESLLKSADDINITATSSDARNNINLKIEDAGLDIEGVTEDFDAGSHELSEQKQGLISDAEAIRLRRNLRAPAQRAQTDGSRTLTPRPR